MERRVEFRGDPEQALRMLYDLPHILSGTVPDRFGLVQSVQLRAAVALLTMIQLDFETKMRGGTGTDGVKWPPLSPKTIAQRPITQADWKTAKLRGTPTKNPYQRGLLTEEQDKAWRKKFASVLQAARMDLPEPAAKAKAAKIAWSYVLNTFNAKTKIAFFGNRVVDILRDTGKLYRSLTPGFADRLANPTPEGQIVIIIPGQITVGTSEKPWHHRGIEGRLPSRPLWPLNDVIPDSWWVHINEAITTGIMELAALLLRKIAQ